MAQGLYGVIPGQVVRILLSYHLRRLSFLLIADKPNPAAKPTASIPARILLPLLREYARAINRPRVLHLSHR